MSSGITSHAKTRDNLMMKGNCKNTINNSPGKIVVTELRNPITANPEYPTIPESQENDLKSNLMTIIEVLKEEMNNPLKK